MQQGPFRGRNKIVAYNSQMLRVAVDAEEGDVPCPHAVNGNGEKQVRQDIAQALAVRELAVIGFVGMDERLAVAVFEIQCSGNADEQAEAINATGISRRFLAAALMGETRADPAAGFGDDGMRHAPV